MKKGLLLGTAMVVLAVINGLIIHKEHVLEFGTTVLLRLAPRDPRSFMQGDHMVLRYELVQAIPSAELQARGSSGLIVIALDDNAVGRFVRFHDDEALAGDEILLRYRRRGILRLGAETFFFQEGHAELYEEARYGELRVAPSGESVLVGLRGQNLERLGPEG